MLIWPRCQNLAIYAKSYIAVAIIRTAHDKALGYFDMIMLINVQGSADRYN